MATTTPKKKVIKKVVSKKTAPAAKETVKKVEKSSSKSSLMLKMYDLAGVSKPDIALPKELFDAKENKTLLTQYIRVYLANQRQGNASTKTRAEVQGSTRKIYKQKGTGRARHGSRRAPIFVGGGTIGGPKNHDYSLKMNKKQKKQALFAALTLKYKEQKTMGLVKESSNIKPKTKLIVEFLEKTSTNKKKILIVLPQIAKNNLVLGARNLSNVTLVESHSINPYILLQNDTIIFSEDSIEALKTHFLKNHEN